MKLKWIVPQDLLPLFDDATDIGSLKDEICQTLEVCGSQINNLKCEMDELAESSESTVKVIISYLSMTVF